MIIRQILTVAFATALTTLSAQTKYTIDASRPADPMKEVRFKMGKSFIRDPKMETDYRVVIEK